MPSVQRTIPLNVPVWLDCDPGNDDAFAILLASFHPSFNLLGISTVHGNVSLRKTTRNTLALLEAMHFSQDEIEVFPGEEMPLEIEPLNAEDIHGTYGIGGTDLPEHPLLFANSSVSYLEALHEAILEYEDQICIVCTGALTNLAKLIEKYPQDIAKVRYVSIMGGAFDCGNIGPNVEFNIRTDPQATRLVFDCAELANKVILAPLNLTHTALATSDVQRAIYDPDLHNNSALRLMFSRILKFYSEAYVKKYNHSGGPPIHDPLALFLLLLKIGSDNTELSKLSDSCDFHFLQRHLKVQTEGPELGRILYATENMDPLRVEKGGVFVGQSVNIPFFWQHIFTALEFADEQVNSRQ